MEVFCVVVLLTSPGRSAADRSVGDGSITGLNVHEGLPARSHEHPLLHAQLCNV